MTDYIDAISAATGHSSTQIETVLNNYLQDNIEPMKFPGSVQWDIWICYLAIRAYERQANTDYPN